MSGTGWGGPPAAVLDAAMAGRSDVIVTGDQDRLPLGPVDQTEILAPRAFLYALQPDNRRRPPRSEPAMGSTGPDRTRPSSVSGG